ncbi:MAG: membrane protein insertion efficiency factor YidD [Planctomycetota bacterium]|jgi:putative membrane protein insertion efficiency factor
MLARPTPLLARPLILAVRLYQVTLRPVMGGQCRFHPSCSEYALEALREHGAWRGSWLTVRRLLRCQPFGGFGYDPVPPRSATGRPDAATDERPSS